MNTQEVNRKTQRDEPQKGETQMQTKKALTFPEQMAEDMAGYYEGDHKRSAFMLDYLASLQEEKAKPH